MFAETPGGLLERVYVSEHFLEKEENRVLLEKSGADYETVSDGVFSHASDTGTPQGILAVVRMPEYGFFDLLRGERTRLLVLEDIQDPGNLGTMFRDYHEQKYRGSVFAEMCARHHGQHLPHAVLRVGPFV